MRSAMWFGALSPHAGRGVLNRILANLMQVVPHNCRNVMLLDAGRALYLVGIQGL